MKTNTEGLILMDQAVGDKDRLLTVLTRDCGVLRCFVRGASSVHHRSFAGTQMLSYSGMTIYRGRERCVIDEVRLIRSFFEPTLDIVPMALEQYLCELAMKLVPENTDSSEQLDLLLNCLYLLNKGRSVPLIKAVFEIRLASLSGWLPNLLYCQECGTYEDDTMYFYYQENALRCSRCHTEAPCCPLSKGALTAFRYVTYAEPKKVFSFQVSDESLRQLSECSEKYVLSMSTADLHLHTLNYYRQVLLLSADNTATTPQHPETS